MTHGGLPTGQTRLLVIVGHPVDQVLAPAMWTRLFLANGVDAACLDFHVLSADLERFVLGLRAVRNLDGLIVTVPHKVAALSLVDHVTDRARRDGAVNSIRRDDDRGGWVGDILDGDGFVVAFESGIRPVRGQRVLVMGSGGVGSAIAFALADSGAVEVNVSDVDSTRASSLAKRLTEAGTLLTVGGARSARLRSRGQCQPRRHATDRAATHRSESRDAWCRRGRRGDQTG
jgi:shikimate dehydrogenase